MIKYIFLLLILSACTGNGAEFNKINIPKSSVVVYRTRNLIVGAAGTYSININGTLACELHNASFFVYPNNGDRIVLTASAFLAPGTTKIEIDAKKGKTYYIRFEENMNKLISTVGAGYVGMFTAEGMSSMSGPYIFTHIESDQAQQELSNLHQDCF